MVWLLLLTLQLHEALLVPLGHLPGLLQLQEQLDHLSSQLLHLLLLTLSSSLFFFLRLLLLYFLLLLLLPLLSVCHRLLLLLQRLPLLGRQGVCQHGGLLPVQLTELVCRQKHRTHPEPAVRGSAVLWLHLVARTGTNFW